MTDNPNPVGLDFLGSAPVRKTLEFEFRHPPKVVFDAIAADPAGWGDWFPGFDHSGHFETAAPHGVASIREITSRGSVLREKVLAWEDGVRWAFVIVAGKLPGIRSLAEDYRFNPSADGTRLSWTIAIDPAPVARLVAPLVLRLGSATFAKAAANLDRVLTERAESGT